MSFIRFSLGLAVLSTLTFSAPSSTQAAWWDDESFSDRRAELASYIDRAEKSRSRGDRYSSSITREIRKLDDDVVKEISIPILIGVSMRNISPNFGDSRGGGTRTHEGLDIMAARGAFVASPTEAVVTRTGEGDSAGIYVYTANPGGETFAYMHLDSIAEGVKPGTVLEAGDIIGYVGNTGNASGGAPHLHFEIRGKDGLVDPYTRIKKEFTLEERIESLKELLATLQKELSKKD